MKTFVTGGTGFVGAHLVRALRASGEAVTCLVRDSRRAAGPTYAGVRLVPGTLRDVEALREGCDGAEVVYHVAGRLSARNLDAYLAVNRDGTARLLEAAGDRGVRRFLYVSTLAVGGPSRPGRPIDEGRAPAPITNYGRSKLAGEEVVRTGAVPWTIVRPPVVYGEGDRETLRLFRLARAGWGPLIGDGTQELSVLYAGDLATALLRAGTTPATANRTYYAAHPAVTTSRALVEAVGRAVGTRPRVVRIPPALARVALWTVGSLAHAAGRDTLLSGDKVNEFVAPAWTCRADALTRDTGWQAGVDLATGLARATAWYRTEGWL